MKKPPPYNHAVLATFDFLEWPVVVYREKNATNDYYVVCASGNHFKAENLTGWCELPRIVTQ